MRDRTRKMRDYLALPTVEEYILVDSRSYRVEMYRREPERWGYYTLGPDDQLTLKSPGVRFPVMDAYRKIHFAGDDSLVDEEALF